MDGRICGKGGFERGVKKMVGSSIIIKIRTFCWQEEVSLRQLRHLESYTNIVVAALNVTLSLDTDTNHVTLDHCISMSTMENGIAHSTSNFDTCRACVKKTSDVETALYNSNTDRHELSLTPFVPSIFYGCTGLRPL